MDLNSSRNSLTTLIEIELIKSSISHFASLVSPSQLHGHVKAKKETIIFVDAVAQCQASSPKKCTDTDTLKRTFYSSSISS